jgi:predicted phage terminase large subunit-like protein
MQIKGLNKWFANVLSDDLSSFITESFCVVNPSTSYLPNWHIDLIAEHLEACTKGEITRLIINMPPRSLKSLSVSVAWPAWLLAKEPSRRIIAASYSQHLSNKHSMDCKLVIESSWYKHVFPKMQFAKGQNEKSKFVTTERGYRMATSVDGSLTGEGGNFLIVDDPIKPSQVHSRAVRQRTIDWFEQTLSSRADDKKKSVIVVVMQRLHEEDLTGHLLKQGTWEHLNIPAISEQRTIVNFKNYHFIREQGHVLHEGREGKKELDRAKSELGSYAFSAQYQQRPVPLKGSVIKQEWIKRYKAKPATDKIIQSWDTAIKSVQGSDYTVCTTWAVTHNGYYLLDVYKEQIEYPELKHSLKNMAEKWRPSTILIEDKASGQSLIQDIKRETALPVIKINPTKDKLTRLAAVSPLFESGRVFFPEVADWLTDYEMELFKFPSTSHDDQVDSTSQFLNWTKLVPQVDLRVRQI